MKIEKVCIYCASSSQVDQDYLKAAEELGEILADNKITIVYGGGSAGLMGALADGALSKNGKVIGIIPDFMDELEWGHKKITELKIVKSMHERKHQVIQGTDAVIALPGGSGTLEELLEAITWKRLGIYLKPIVLVNILGFFDPLIDQLNRCVEERFMDSKHKSMWSVVNHPEEVLTAIYEAPEWSSDARNFAAL